MRLDLINHSPTYTPMASTPPPADDNTRTRRLDGVRQPVSDTVVFHRGEEAIDGWALNLSRGGLRAAVEAEVEVGDEFDIVVGESEPRPGRIVWVRNQKDGSIVGVSFSDADGSVPPPPAMERQTG